MDVFLEAWRTMLLLVTSSRSGTPLEHGAEERDDALARDGERGQGLAEYSLIIGLVAVVAILGLAFLGGQISNLFWAPISAEFGNVLEWLLG